MTTARMSTRPSKVGLPSRALRTAKAGPRTLILLVFAAFFAGPIVWLVLAPTKDRTGLFERNPFAFGSFSRLHLTMRNLFGYNHDEILTWLINSAWYAAASVAIAIAAVIPAGYALAKHMFPGRRLILMTTLIAMVIPVAALVLPLFLEMHLLKLLGNPLSVILPLSMYPFGVYLAYVYFHANIPTSLLEAARIDGANEFRIFTKVVLPLSRPIVGLVTFFGFVHTWNNFFLPFVMLNDDHRYTLQIGLLDLLDSAGAISPLGGQSTLPIHEPEAALAGLITILPVLLVYIFAVRYLTAGQLAGAEKG